MSLLTGFYPDMSTLSASFVRSIGRSTDSLARDASPTSDSHALPSTSPFRLSSETDRYSRSPTPGSLRYLLDRSTTSSPYSLQLGPRVGGEDHEVITLGRSAGADDDAASIASFASRVSTRGPGALKLQQAWEGQNRPGSGHAPHVGLSEQEARGALIRVGGHLVGAIISYALVAPFVFSRSLEGGSLRLPAADYGLICGIALPSTILAWQCAASQGIWFRSASSATARAASPAPTDMTTDHVVVDMEERPESQASTIRSYKDCVVGIETDGADVASTRRGSLGEPLPRRFGGTYLPLLIYGLLHRSSGVDAFEPTQASNPPAARPLDFSLFRRPRSDARPPSIPALAEADRPAVGRGPPERSRSAMCEPDDLGGARGAQQDANPGHASRRAHRVVPPQESKGGAAAGAI